MLNWNIKLIKSMKTPSEPSGPQCGGTGEGKVLPEGSNQSLVSGLSPGLWSLVSGPV